MPLHAALIQKILSTNSHIGRRLTSHHLIPHLAAIRNTLPIIDSDKTLISLRTAIGFISHLSCPSTPLPRPARFLFINTNPHYDNIFDSMTRLTGHTAFLSPQAQFWRNPGFLTNPYSPKRFKGRNKKLCFAPIDPPDCVVVVDFDGKCSAVNEAARAGVPVVALVNSSVDLRVFEKIAYPVVVGCESVEFVYLFCNLITKTFLMNGRGKGRDGVLSAIDDDIDNVDDLESGDGDDGNANVGVSDVFGDDGNFVNASGSGVFGDDGNFVNASGSGVFGDDGDVLNASGSDVFGDGGDVLNANGSSVFGDDGDVLNASDSGVFGDDIGVMDANRDVDGPFGITPAMSP